VFILGGFWLKRTRTIVHFVPYVCEVQKHCLPCSVRLRMAEIVMLTKMIACDNKLVK